MVFTALYLLVHGIVQVILVVARLPEKLWAYVDDCCPRRIHCLPALPIDADARGWPSALAVFDILIVVLIWHEDGRHRQRRKETA